MIVEGIETSQQADYFNSGTNHILGQGWFFGHPVSAEAFFRLLAEQEMAALAEAHKDCAASSKTR